MMEEARQAYKQGRYPDAIRLLETQMAQAPDERTRLMLARAYERNGQLNEARSSYTALLHSQDPQLLKWAEQGLAQLTQGALPYESLQEWCRQTPAALFFRIGKDTYWLDGTQLRLESGSTLVPTLSFPIRELQPVISKDRLAPFEGNLVFRVIRGQEAQLLTFEAMARAVAEIPSDLASRLMRKGLLTPQGLAQLQSDIRLGETLGAALLRLNLITLAKLIEATIGSQNLPRGYHRPLGERLGIRAARNKQTLLKQALSRQASEPKPLGALLNSLGIPQIQIEEALASQTPLRGSLAEADSQEAWLLRWRRSRTESDPRYLERAQKVRQLLHRALLKNNHRLGTLLVEKGAIKPEQLSNALAWQVDQPYPLGELLAMHRLCAPEQIIEGLLQQQERYREEAEKQLPPLAPPPAKVEEKKNSRQWMIVVGILVGTIILGWGGNRLLFSWLRRAPQSVEDNSLAGRMLGGPLVHDPGALDSEGASGRQRWGSKFSGNLKNGKLASQMASSDFGRFEGNKLQNFESDGFQGNKPGKMEGRSFEGNVLNPPAMQGEVEKGKWEKTRSGPMQGHLKAKSVQSAAFAKLEAKLKQLRLPSGKLKDPLAAARLVAELIRSEQERLGLLNEGFLSGMDPADVNHTSALFCNETGESYLEGQSFASAASEFLTAITLDPTVSPPYYHLGTLVEKAGDKQSATAFYKRYLQVAPVGRYSSNANERLKTLSRDFATGRRVLK